MNMEENAAMNNRAMEHQTILVVLPHPDDEAYFVSGTLAGYIARGSKVTYACLTLGEMGRNMGVPLIANRITLPEIRKKELAASCKAIGIQDLRMLGFHDKMIEFEDPALLDQRIGSLITEVAPSLVITFYPGYSVHPDHDATGAAVIRTIARMPAAERPAIHSVAFSNGHQQRIGAADVVMDVTPYITVKINSILAHRTQFQEEKVLGGLKPTDPAICGKYGTERFWTYRFDEMTGQPEEAALCCQ